MCTYSCWQANFLFCFSSDPHFVWQASKSVNHHCRTFVMCHRFGQMLTSGFFGFLEVSSLLTKDKFNEKLDILRYVICEENRSIWNINGPMMGSLSKASPIQLSLSLKSHCLQLCKFYCRLCSCHKILVFGKNVNYYWTQLNRK